MRPLPAFVLIPLLLAEACAQGTPADYERASALPRRWAALERQFRPSWRWLEDGRQLAFLDERTTPPVWVLVDKSGHRRTAARREDLGIPDVPVLLPPQERWRPSRDSTRATTIRFDNRFDRPVRLFWAAPDGALRPYGEVAPRSERELSTYEGHQWVVDFAADDLAGIFVAAREAGRAIVDAQARDAAMSVRERTGPAGAGRVFLRDHDLWLRRGDGAETRLSTTGRAGNAFRLPGHWSPDGNRMLAFQVEEGEQRRLTLVEAAPADQLQPKVHELAYRKPGDRIDRLRPCLFDVAADVQVEVDEAPFAEAWAVDRVHWAADGSEVYCLYNRRGHQLLRVLAIDARTGAVRTVLEERSATFVDWSQKTFLHWLDGGRSFLWMSERDGWNHLYRVDAATGGIVQLTRGPWLVRSVERVDEAAGAVWITACGLHPDQDPYHAHLARVAFDGTVTALTSADGTHEWTWAPDRRSFVVRWSRVDQPWVTEWRDAATGALLAELGRDDAAALLAAGFRPPLRYVAKGRDGSTDIHGILILPSTFDPQRRYPVIEDVYAGPQDHFVPKRWGLGRRQRELAELGFVVAQIDGMGTNWRHKAFHDVCWRNLKDGGLPDRVLWLREAAKAHPFLDVGRVGIFGGSAGGQTALAALLHHGDFYSVAVADCGCHENRLDKIWWNEAWMGWPIGPWYADSSNVTHAGRLRGRLLLTVGALDRNVDPSSTMQVVQALIAADKDFDLVVVPNGGHGVGETAYLVRRRQDFFVRHLLGVEPRRQ
jgi:dipeptidyl aminopeptidase/acylaminoacyl peptidase